MSAPCLGLKKLNLFEYAQGQLHQVLKNILKGVLWSRKWLVHNSAKADPSDAL